MSDPHVHSELEDRLERMEARLERLEEELEHARADARTIAHGGHDDRGPKFYESGTVHPELDDQTIAPPG